MKWNPFTNIPFLHQIFDWYGGDYLQRKCNVMVKYDGKKGMKIHKNGKYTIAYW